MAEHVTTADAESPCTSNVSSIEAGWYLYSAEIRTSRLSMKNSLSHPVLLTVVCVCVCERERASQ